MSIEALLSEVTPTLGLRPIIEAADQAYYKDQRVLSSIKAEACGPQSHHGAAYKDGHAAGGQRSRDNSHGNKSSDKVRQAINDAKQTANQARGGRNHHASYESGELSSLRQEVHELKEDSAALRKEVHQLKEESSALRKEVDELRQMILKNYNISQEPCEKKAEEQPKKEAAAAGSEDDEEKKRITEEHLNKSVDERLDMLHQFFLKAKKDNLLQDHKKLLNEAERLELKVKSPILLTDVLFDVDVLNQIKTYEVLFCCFLKDDPKAQRHFLGGIEQLVEKYKKQLLSLAPNIIKSIYDLKLVGEEVILAWGAKPSSKYTSMSFAKQVIAECQPVLKWLKSDEDDDERTREIGTVSDSIKIISVVNRAPEDDVQ